MPLRQALGVSGTVAGHRLGALEGGGGTPPPFQSIPAPPPPPTSLLEEPTPDAHHIFTWMTCLEVVVRLFAGGVWRGRGFGGLGLVRSPQRRGLCGNAPEVPKCRAGPVPMSSHTRNVCSDAPEVLKAMPLCQGQGGRGCHKDAQPFFFFTKAATL